MMTCSREVMLKATQVSELRPSSLKLSTLALEALYTTKSGSKLSSSSWEGWMNIFLMKCACQATSTMKRTAMRVSLFAPQKASTTNRRLLHSSLTASFFTWAHTSSLMGWLSFL